MNIFRNIFSTAIAAVLLMISASPATSGDVRTKYNNFNDSVLLDTSQVEAPKAFTADDYVCFTSVDYPEWSCVPARKANPKIFTDDRITNIEIVTMSKEVNDNA